MNVPLAYLNGRFLPFSDAALPLHDAGFVSGATVVDNARTYRHQLFRWSDHLARFRHDCAACYVPLEASDAQLTTAAAELIAHNAQLLPPGGELQLVTFATPGPLGVYLGTATAGSPTLGMVTYPLPFARYRRFFTDGVTLALVGMQPPGATVLAPTVKHRSRMLWHVADHIARSDPRHPHAVAVLASGPDGSLTETGVANLLAVVDGAVTSPPRELILDGISLRTTKELCGPLGIPFTEQRVGLDDLSRVSEMLLTGTGFGLAGVRELYVGNADPVRFAWPGPVLRKLLAGWSNLVGLDLEQQFIDSAAGT